MASYLESQGYQWQPCGWVASEERIAWLRRTYAAHLSADACELLTTAHGFGNLGMRYEKRNANAVAELLDAGYVRMSFYAPHIWTLPSAEACIDLITPEPAHSLRIIKWDGFGQQEASCL